MFVTFTIRAVGNFKAVATRATAMGMVTEVDMVGNKATGVDKAANGQARDTTRDTEAADTTTNTEEDMAEGPSTTTCPGTALIASSYLDYHRTLKRKISLHSSVGQEPYWSPKVTNLRLEVLENTII